MLDIDAEHIKEIDEPISMQTSIGTYYYLFDGLGSVTGLTDDGGDPPFFSEGILHHPCSAPCNPLGSLKTMPLHLLS